VTLTERGGNNTNEIPNQKSTHRAQTSAKQLTPYSIYFLR